MDVHEKHDAPTASSDLTHATSHLTDAELVLALSEGRLAALGEVNRRYRAMMRGEAARVVGRDQAEDVVQDVLLRVVANASGIADGDRLKAWLRTTARNAALDHVRSARARREEVRAALPVSAVAPSPESEVEARVLSASLLSVVPRPDAELLAERYLQESSVPELALQRGVTVNNARVMLHRARARARDSARRAGLRGSAIPGFDWLRQQLGTAFGLREAVGVGAGAVALVVGLSLGGGVLDGRGGPAAATPRPQASGTSAGGLSSPDGGAASGEGQSGRAGAAGSDDEGPTSGSTTSGGATTQGDRTPTDTATRIPVPGTRGEITIGETDQPKYEIRLRPADQGIITNDRENSTTPIAGEYEDRFGDVCRTSEQQAEPVFECIEREDP